MPRNQVFQTLANLPSARFRFRTVTKKRQRVNRFFVNQNLHFNQIGFLIAGQLIVKAGITAGNRFQTVIKVKNDFVQRNLINHHSPAADIGQLMLFAAAFGTEFENRAEIFVRHHNRRLDHRLLNRRHLRQIGHIGRIVQRYRFAVGHMDFIGY